MASPALEAQIRSLSAKIEGEAKVTMDEIERTLLRPISRNSYACILKCHDDAGTRGTSEQLQHCAQNCQRNFQMSQSIMQQEVNQFQERLNRSMMQCQDEARDLMTPDIQSNPNQMRKIEDKIVKCMSKTVDHHIGLLKPLKKRIADQLKSA